MMPQPVTATSGSETRAGQCQYHLSPGPGTGPPAADAAAGLPDRAATAAGGDGPGHGLPCRQPDGHRDS